MPTPPDLASASSAIRWRAGEARQRGELEPLVQAMLAERGVVWVRHRDARRRLAWARLPDGRRLFLKHFLRDGRHRLREGWKRRLHLGAAEREWRALVRLRRSGIPVPEPLAHFVTEGGEHVVVTAFVEGTPLEGALDAPRRERATILEAVGKAVRSLHRAGWTHRDLHRENLLVTEAGVVLTDLQAAVRLPSARARLRDLGELDHSLSRLLSVAERVRLRAAALGLSRPYHPAARAALRAVGRASLARARASVRSRRRRSLRAGRRARVLRVEGARGLIRRDADEAAVRAALANPSVAGLAIRRYPARLPDVWRGSPARRAWAAAHALEAGGVGRLAPVAFLEWRRLGLPLRSALVLEAPTPAAALSAAERAGALVSLWTRLHEVGFSAPRLDGAGVALVRSEAGVEGRVSALECVRGPRRLSDDARLASLALLDASLEAQQVPPALRDQALGRYCARLPFAVSRSAVARELPARREPAGELRSAR